MDKPGEHSRQANQRYASALLKLENGPNIPMRLWYTDTPQGEQFVWHISRKDGLLLEQFVKMQTGVGDAQTTLVV